MKRLFTFGCSFTQYWRWPTWADALGRQYDWFENWGLSGAGNSYILYSLMECHKRHVIGSTDTVYIMWTNTSREDRYVGNRWIEGGNVYWLIGNPLGEDYVKRFACERGYLIRDLAVIAAVQNLLDAWQCDHRFFSMVPLVNINHDVGLGENPEIGVGDLQDVRDLYQDALSRIGPSVYDIIFHGDWNSRPGIPDKNNSTMRDFHPTPREHTEYIDSVMPGVMLPDTREWMAHTEDMIRNQTLTWNQPNRPTVRL
jgi:hypothetical protein